MLDITIKNHDLVSAMPEYDIIRVAGILIDNALEASQRTDTVRLTLGSSDGKIEIETLNKGQQLTHELRQQMFDAGYTSKQTRTLHVINTNDLYPVHVWLLYFCSILRCFCFFLSYSSTSQKSLMVAK